MSEITKFGADLIQAMSEASAHSEGKFVTGMRVHSVDLGSVDAKAIRQRFDWIEGERVAVRITSPTGGQE